MTSQHTASSRNKKHNLSHPSLLRRIRQPLHHILSPRHTHNRHPWHLPDPPLQIPIVRRHQPDPLLDHPVHDAVIGVDALMGALEPLPALVARDLQGEPVFRTELFELGHYARGNCGGYGGEEGVLRDRVISLQMERDLIGLVALEVLGAIRDGLRTIRFGSRSSLCWMVWLRKLVS